MFYFRSALLSICVLVSLPSSAQSSTLKESVSFKAGTVVGGETDVIGELKIPETKAQKFPAVVIIHSAGGFEDKTRETYVAALNQAGIATLELNLFSAGGRPKSTRDNLPHTFGALIYLSNHPRIDPNQIGITGYSWGGLLSMFSSSKALNNEFTAGKYRFAAHLPVYPVCWAHLAVLEGKNPVYKPAVYQELTGAPIHILAGEKDDYDDSDSCSKFVAGLPADAKKHVALTVYPDVGHGWDSPIDKTYPDASAFKGRGGTVRHYRHAATAEKSKELTVNFFRTHLLGK